MFGLSTALFPQATIVSHLNPPCNVDQFSGGSREGARGGQVPAPYFFFSKMRPEGPKKFIFETGAPPPLSQCLDDHPPVSDGLDLPLQFAVFRSRFPHFVTYKWKVYTKHLHFSLIFSYRKADFQLWKEEYLRNDKHDQSTDHDMWNK